MIMTYSEPITIRSVFVLANEYARLASEVAALSSEHIVEYEQFSTTVPQSVFSLMGELWRVKSKLEDNHPYPAHYQYPAIEHFRAKAAQFSLQLALLVAQDQTGTIKLTRKLHKKFSQFLFEFPVSTLKLVVERETLEAKIAALPPELVAECERFKPIHEPLTSFERLKSKVATLPPDFAAVFEQIGANAGVCPPDLEEKIGRIFLSKVPLLKYAELVERLERLAKSVPPSPHIYRNYMPDLPQPCSRCGQSVYKDCIVQRYKWDASRLYIQGLDATLIVPEFCEECGLPLEGKKCWLEIKYPDQSILVRVELDSAEDLRIMESLLEGADRYLVDWGKEPLKDKIDRLKELFGIKEEQWELL